MTILHAMLPLQPNQQSYSLRPNYSTSTKYKVCIQSAVKTVNSSVRVQPSYGIWMSMKVNFLKVPTRHKKSIKDAL